MLSNDSLKRLQNTLEEPDLEGTRYQIIQRIGSGGMGVVFLAHDVDLKRKVALKVMNVADSTGKLASRMWREARIVAQLEHPGIVPIHDVGVLEDGRVFYAMKYVEGKRLDQYRNNESSLPESLRVFERICEAVAFANAHGVIHRDLKPENIMVGPFGEVLVMDWGIAKVLQDHEMQTAFISEFQRLEEHTQHGTIVGTQGYMSPEQECGETVTLDQRTDIYSLGAVLYFLITRKHPTGDIDSEFSQGTPKRLAAICRKAMSYSPADRYSDAKQIAADISRFMDHQPVSAYHENIFERAVRWIDRNRSVVYLIATYLLLRFLVLVITKR